MLRKSARLAALLGFIVAPAAAQDRPTWFLDLEGGIGIGRSISPRYYDRIGSQFTSNPTLGDDVLPSNLTARNKSPAAAVAAGRFLTDNLYVRSSLRYFGADRSIGSAAYPQPDRTVFPFWQSQYSTALGVFIGPGITYALTDWLYLDASVETGASFIHSGGTHDVNVTISQPFPKKWRTNLAGGAGIGFGYRLLPNLDLVLNGNYDYLGTAVTGITCHCTLPGRPDDPARRMLGLRNYLTSKLSAVTILAGIRFRM